MAFVRAFGVLRPDTTPCGQPMSVSEAHALHDLARDGDLRQAELGRRLGLDKSTVSRLVDGLAERGWVERRRDPADRRAVAVALTDAGRAAAARLGEARAARYAALLDRLPVEERPAAVRALRLLADGARPADDAGRAG